ncbi:unnamed protein product [Heligmosomoides polygyrus]|uniref:Extensin-like n=1 Tax=Heligmosomoides polygyrus TaxID=6339 RepID=A0A183GKD0_HELPZ|nr:unnamed protein product [Heligmosomoides polygyrus]
MGLRRVKSSFSVLTFFMYTRLNSVLSSFCRLAYDWSLTSTTNYNPERLPSRLHFPKEESAANADAVKTVEEIAHLGEQLKKESYDVPPLPSPPSVPEAPLPYEPPKEPYEPVGPPTAPAQNPMTPTYVPPPKVPAESPTEAPVTPPPGSVTPDYVLPAQDVSVYVPPVAPDVPVQPAVYVPPTEAPTRDGRNIYSKEAKENKSKKTVETVGSGNRDSKHENRDSAHLRTDIADDVNEPSHNRSA